MYRVIVAGGRDFQDYELLKEQINKAIAYFKLSQIEIVSGGCRGADILGEKYASENGYPVKRFIAQWDKYGKAAGAIRNKEMAEYVSASDGCLIAFWDGKSKGTKNMIEEMRRAGKHGKVIFYEKS